MRLSISLIAALLIVSFANTTAAIDIKEVYFQTSNTSYALNETISALNSETAPEVKEIDALKMELDYLKNNFRSLEPWYAADKTNIELQDKLQSIYLDALDIELRSKLLRGKLIQQDIRSTLSSASSKADASTKLTSLSDPVMQSAEISLAEANRLLIQAVNITVTTPSYPGTVDIKNRIKAMDEKLYLMEQGQKEVKYSILQADKILNRIQEQKTLASEKMQEFDGKIAEINASINALKTSGINTVEPESSMQQAQQLKFEAEKLISTERYEDALSKFPVGINLLQQANKQLQEAKDEHREGENKRNLGIGFFVIVVVVLAIVWIRRPPNL